MWSCVSLSYSELCGLSIKISCFESFANAHFIDCSVAIRFSFLLSCYVLAFLGLYFFRNKKKQKRKKTQHTTNKRISKHPWEKEKRCVSPQCDSLLFTVCRTFHTELTALNSFVFECFSTSFNGKFMDIVLSSDSLAKSAVFMPSSSSSLLHFTFILAWISTHNTV